MLRTGAFCAAVSLAFAGIAMLHPSQAHAQNFRVSELYFVHGLPGNELDDPLEMIDFPNDLPVDICVGIPGSGTLNCFFANVPLGQARGPLLLTTGTYQVEMRQANFAAPGTGALVDSATVTLQRGDNHTALLHISLTGAPVINDFLNDDSRIASTSARATFRHGAREGAVDMSLLSTMGQPGIAAPSLQNPQQSAVSNIAAGPYVLFVKPAGQAMDLVAPANVFLNSRNAYFFYLVGSTERGTIRVITHNFALKAKFFQ